MKTIKKRLQKLKSKYSKKNQRRMIGGSLDSNVMANTRKLLQNTMNYLKITGSKTYYTQVSFDLTPNIIDALITYGLNPGLGGSIVDTSQPYIIYFFIYYYTSKIFSEFFNMTSSNEEDERSNMDLYLVGSGELSKKSISSTLDIVVGETYYIFVNLSSISSIITLGTNVTQMVIRFTLQKSETVSGAVLSKLVINGIYMLKNVEDVDTDNYRKGIIKKLGNNDLSDLSTPVPYSDDVRYKIKSIVLYSFDIEKQIISLQSSNTKVYFVKIDNTKHLKFSKPFSVSLEFPHHISATFLTFINKLSDTLKGNVSSTVSANEANKMMTITENYIPNVLNVYLSTPSYSPVTLDNVLLKRNMFPPYNASSNELQINPRYDFTRIKSAFTKQYCKSNKQCYVDTLFSVSEFTKFNKKNKMGKRLQTIQQVTPNITGNIETTLSLLLPNNTLKINGQEFVVSDYNWDHKWKLTGPKENLLSLQPQFLQGEQLNVTMDTQLCYKSIFEFYDDLIELFYPSMSGKDITKIYGNYLRILNERNILLNDVKRLVNKKTYSIKTDNLNEEDKNKISSIQTKSITLNEYINKFINAILYQLIIIGNITRKLVNKIHSPCFFYFGFDDELYKPPNPTPPNPTPPELRSIVPNVLKLANVDDNNINKNINQLSSMYYPNYPNKEGDNYSRFFTHVLCSNLVIEEYKNIISSFSNVIKSVFERLDKIAGRMIEIRKDASYEPLNLTNETLSKLWISDEAIEKNFSDFEKNIRAFIKYNFTDDYYSRYTIEKWIDGILWDIDKSDSYTYCRLFTTFVYDNIWKQFEYLFSLKVLQYIFLIYQYTGKYIYYTNIQNNNVTDNFQTYLEEGVSEPNLFSCVILWFKYNCIVQIQTLLKDGDNIGIRDIQYLFASNELIIGSYALMKYYITQIIIMNLDVCRLTSELQTFVDILSPNDNDLKNIMPQSVDENEKNKDNVDKNKPGANDKGDDKNKSQEPNTNIFAYNVQVQLKVKQITGDKEPKDKLTSNNIDEYLGCKNRDLLFKLNKLKQSTGVLSNDITGYISSQTATLTTLNIPNISQLRANLESSNDRERILKLFDNPEFIQIISSINLPENKGTGKTDSSDNFFVRVNRLVYDINLETKRHLKTPRSDVKFSKEYNESDFIGLKSVFELYVDSKLPTN